MFQNKTFAEERKQGILWAPKQDKSGGPPVFHWKNMLLCEAGDIVFSIVKNAIVSKGIVNQSAQDSDNPFDNDLWLQEGWQVSLTYHLLNHPVSIKDNINQIRPYLPNNYSPFQRNGRGNQGYLFHVDDELGQLLNQLVGYTQIEHNDHILYRDEVDQRMIESLRKAYGDDDAEVTLVEEAPPEGRELPQASVTKVYGKKTDYIKKAEKDLKQGLLAEDFVVSYEKKSLIALGRSDLAKKVQHVSKEADGHGYDVISYDESGNPKYIEVKSTTMDANHPFDISKNEISTSEKLGDNYWIYRVYHIEEKPAKVYKVKGAVEEHFDLIPSSFKAFKKR